MDVFLSRLDAKTIALGVSGLLNIALLGAVVWPDAEETTTPDAAVVVVQDEAVEAPAEPTEEVVAEKPAPPKNESKAPAADEVRVGVAKLSGSIPQTMASVAAPHGDNVSATLSRLLVWDLDLRKDLRKDDLIEAAWTLGTTDTVVIQAARYQSQKHGKTLTAYRFKAEGDEYASYWSADGTEVPHRLRKSPLSEYEQVTSLLKDRPTHHGMDFKVDTGTPVATGYDGVVTRTNWNWSANGNCVEVRHTDGTLAKYLHLSENKVEPGDRVKAGQVIALSGNTGRSTGPHLHYQLNQGKKVVDPIDYHGTDRRKLSEADLARFESVVKAADLRFESAGALAAR